MKNKLLPLTVSLLFASLTNLALPTAYADAAPSMQPSVSGAAGPGAGPGAPTSGGGAMPGMPAPSDAPSAGGSPPTGPGTADALSAPVGDPCAALRKTCLDAGYVRGAKAPKGFDYFQDCFMKLMSNPPQAVAGVTPNPADIAMCQHGPRVPDAAQLPASTGAKAPSDAASASAPAPVKYSDPGN